MCRRAALRSRLVSPLPRRPFLGVVLDPAPAPLVVRRVAPGSMAEEAGLREGDVLIAIDAEPVSTLPGVLSALAGTRPRVAVRVRRGGETLERTVARRDWPVERVEGAEVELGEVTARGARLRTLTVRPAAPAATVLVLQGIGCASVDYGLAPDEPLARLVRGWAAAGFASVRVDKRGVGDSEGGPALGADFEAEREGYRAALASISGPTFLFGHSVGGMIAPLLDGPVEGVIVYGTTSLPWLECLLRTSRRQYALRGVTAPEVERRLRAHERLHAAIVAGDATAWRDDPELAALAPDGLPYGRSAEFSAQLHATDLAGAWGRVTAPVLCLHGEHDWVVGADEHDLLARAAVRAEVTRVELPKLDHAFGRHADEAGSVARYGAGDPDDEPLTTTVAWMRGVLAAGR